MAGEQRTSRFKERACAFCGEAFRTAEPTKKYCSPMCRGKADEARAHRRKQPAPSREEG